MPDRISRIPVTIVTGFLGSGKTTLLNHLLSGRRLGRVAALVNDFGAIDIDAALVASVADEVVQLTNGCICCTINGDLYASVERILSLNPAVDRIVVETTGLADPLPVGLTFLQTDLRTRTLLESVVAVVDCANFALDLFKADAAMAQVAHADIIALNKTDLVTPETVASLHRRISLIKPRAVLIPVAFGRVPFAAILSPSNEPSLASVPGNGSPAHRHLLDDGFTAHAFQYPQHLSATALQRWLDAGLGEGVFRAKGIFALDRPAGRFSFQFCGGRASFEPYEGPLTDTRLVFIGRGIDGTQLQQEVVRCLCA
jgi:G3E family GTPase